MSEILHIILTAPEVWAALGILAVALVLLRQADKQQAAEREAKRAGGHAV